MFGVVFDLGGTDLGAVLLDGQLKCLGGVLLVSIRLLSQFETTRPTMVSGVLNSTCTPISNMELLLGSVGTSMA